MRRETRVPRPTIADVARQAQVSKSTVSRVLNGQTSAMRATTHERVEQAIADLGYRPSALARSLTLGRSRTIGLLISDVGNPFYAEVIQGVEDLALSEGYSLFTANTRYDLLRAERLIASLADHEVDGVIVMSSMLSERCVALLRQRGIPAVVIDWPCQVEIGRVGAVRVDYASGIDQAIEHLVSMGHRVVGHLSGPAHLPTSQTRTTAFLEAMAARGLDAQSAPVVTGTLRMEGAGDALASFLAHSPQPTAILAANDQSALGLLFAAHGMGLSIPGDLSLVGLDDIRLASQVSPSLTTIALPRLHLGRMATEMLLGLVQGQAAEPPIATVTTRLVVRSSTAPTMKETR